MVNNPCHQLTVANGVIVRDKARLALLIQLISAPDERQPMTDIGLIS